VNSAFSLSSLKRHSVTAVYQLYFAGSEHLGNLMARVQSAAESSGNLCEVVKKMLTQAQGTPMMDRSF
jgi:hypothetical protein